MLRKSHSSEEVTAKLREADELATTGKTQQEIARLLGVSVMTVHRWRKKNEPLPQPTPRRPQLDSTAVTGRVEGVQRDHIEEEIERLELENSRLRRLIPNLLLENLQLEEMRKGPTNFGVRKHQPRK